MAVRAYKSNLPVKSDNFQLYMVITSYERVLRFVNEKFQL